MFIQHMNRDQERAYRLKDIQDLINDFAKVFCDPLQDAENNLDQLSDGCHTFDSLYEQRCYLFAALVNTFKEVSWKSRKHSDGVDCFDGTGWFIVGIDTPEGSYTYHYKNKYWDLFHCQELPVGKEWDGHTEKDVTRLMSLENKPEHPKSKRCHGCIYDHDDCTNPGDCSRDEVTGCLTGYTTQAGKTANWIIWSGWSGNHDQRIDDAKCSGCGYVHPTVYGSVKKLSAICPGCKSKMGVVEK